MVQGAETQRALRRQARKLFAQKATQAPTRTSSWSARVTKGALYHHFANKKELYQAVVEDMEQELVERLEAAGAGRAWNGCPPCAARTSTHAASPR